MVANSIIPILRLLLRASADVNRLSDGGTNGGGKAALHEAAFFGRRDLVEVLLEAGANASLRDVHGKTAAEYAVQWNHPTLVPLLDPGLARTLGKRLRAEFSSATTVHVLSTKFKRTEAEINAAGFMLLCDPAEAARIVKAQLEKATPGTKVFNPNEDNVYLMDGDPESANAIWLLNWRTVGLRRAKETGGYCIQIVVQGGLSKMQEAEEDMANSDGVPVIRLRCDNLSFLDAETEEKSPVGTYVLNETSRVARLVEAVRVPHASLREVRPPSLVKAFERTEITGEPDDVWAPRLG